MRACSLGVFTVVSRMRTVALAVALGAGTLRAQDLAPRAASRADSLPRKVVVATALANFSGTLDERLALAAALVEQAAQEVARIRPGRGLDLVVLPEFALGRSSAAEARARAVPLDGPVLDVLGARAREQRTWLVVPLTLAETLSDGSTSISNAAVLLDRAGNVAGIFRKVHPIVDDAGVFEGGVTPGNEYPVFPCDFGRLGLLICWDMSYDDAWAALAAAGAEIVAVPSASPQTVRPAAEALRHGYHVVTSTPRDNVTIFDPTGQVAAQRTAAGMLVHELDLACAILHWSEILQEGRALTARWGERVGYRYSSREDTGVFWSNDPGVSIGTMIRELGLREMADTIARVDAARRARAQPAHD